MDISTITDLNQLKAMAYDFYADQENASNNLRLVNARITEVKDAQQLPDLSSVSPDANTIIAEPDIAPEEPTPDETNEEKAG